jgi:hypothetical protein
MSGAGTLKPMLTEDCATALPTLSRHVKKRPISVRVAPIVSKFRDDGLTFQSGFRVSRGVEPP